MRKVKDLDGDYLYHRSGCSVLRQSRRSRFSFIFMYPGERPGITSGHVCDMIVWVSLDLGGRAFMQLVFP